MEGGGSGGGKMDSRTQQINKFAMAVTALLNVKPTYRKILRKVLLATQDDNDESLLVEKQHYLCFAVFSPAGLDAHKAKSAYGALQAALTSAVAPSTMRWRGSFTDLETAPPVLLRIWSKSPESDRGMYTLHQLYPQPVPKPALARNRTDASIVTLPAIPTKWTHPEPWSDRPRSQLCDVCCEPISFCRYSDRVCVYCNVVAHVACLPEDQRNAEESEWVCGSCVAEFQQSRGYVIASEQQRQLYEKQWRAQARIAAFWRRLKAEAVYKRTLNKITVLQAGFRGLAVRKHFALYYQNLPKPYRITVLRATDLPVADWDTGAADPYVVISVLDHKYEQKWRLQTRLFNDELNPVFDETFMVPGITGLSTIVFTVIDEDPLRHQFMGQAMVSLKEHNRWKTSSKLTLSLVGKMYSVRDSVGQLARLDYGTISPQGVLEVEIQPLVGCDMVCGSVLGPNIDELAKAGVYMRNQELESSLRPIWATLADRKLYLCKRLGEMPRYVMDLCTASVHIHRDGSELGLVFTPDRGPRIKLFMIKHWEMMRWRVAVMMTYARMRSRPSVRYKNVYQMLQLAVLIPEDRVVTPVNEG